MIFSRKKSKVESPITGTNNPSIVPTNILDSPLKASKESISSETTNQSANKTFVSGSNLPQQSEKIIANKKVFLTIDLYAEDFAEYQ